MFKKEKFTLQIGCKNIVPPSSQPLIAVYEAHLDMTFNTNSEERLKVIADQLGRHMPPVTVRKVGRRYELVTGYREFHLAKKFDVTSLDAEVVGDMPSEKLFEFAVTGCVTALLALDTKNTAATNAQLRGFYRALCKNLDNEFEYFLSSDYLADLLNIPASHLRAASTAQQSRLERQREQAESKLKKQQQTPKNSMSKFSLKDLHTKVEPTVMENEDWLESIWVQYLSKEQVALLKNWLSESPRVRIPWGDRHA